MRTLPRLVVIVCLTAILAGLGPLPREAVPFARGDGLGGGLAWAGELEDAQEELERIQRLIEETQAEMRRLESQERSLIADLNRIDRELETLQASLNRLQGQLAATEAAIGRTEVEIADAQVRLSQRTALMLKRIRALSEVGYVNYLEVILGARSFSDFLSRFELLRQILACDVTLFREVREEKRQLEVKKAFLEEQRAELSLLKSETAARKAAVEDRQEAKTQILARLRQDLEAVAEAEDELERASERLKEYILRLQLEAQQSGQLPRFVWPLEGPITSRFGPRYHPILKVMKNHTGIDIAAPIGRRVNAAASGTVIYADWFGGYGKAVMIAHPGRATTVYAHLSVISVRNGQVVAEGGKIGEVGSTGYSTGPHLHFEIRLNGEPVDPERFLP